MAWRAGLFGLIFAIAATPALAQVGFDRWGGDYYSAPLRSGDPATCAARCERDARCRAWAFSYPATENPNAVCWLKSRVTARITLAARGACRGIAGAQGLSLIHI